jgi:ABC-type Fe3+ transport system substrate-binding protein
VRENVLMRFRAFCLFAAFVVCCWLHPALAIEQSAIDAARKEGSVTWYTTQIVNQLARPMADAFKAKYGINVEAVRGDTSDVVRRVQDEAKAGLFQCDVFDGTITVPALKRSNLVLKWLPDVAKDLPKEFVDPDGYWIAIYVFVVVPAVNTELVPAGQEPKTWEDLLDPKWKGKMAWSSSPSSTGGPGFVGMVLKEYGDEKGNAFLDSLAKQNVASIPFSTRQILDQVIAGEYQIGIMSSNHHVKFSADQGAPVKWLPVSPGMVDLITVSVALNAPHPNAAKLFLDFMMSDQGQAIFRDNYYIPASPHVAAKDAALLPNGRNFRGLFFTPEEIDAQMPQWYRRFKELFQ